MRTSAHLQIDPDQLAAAATDDAAFRQLPVGLRVLLAATALAARNERVSAAAVAKAAHASRTTLIRKGSPWRALVDAVTDNPTGPLDRLDVGLGDAKSTGTLEGAEIAKRDALIGDLRRELKETKRSIAPLKAYAHDLAVELRTFRDEQREELDSRVVHLWPVEDDPHENQDDA